MEDRVLSLEKRMASVQGEMKKINKSISEVTEMLQGFLQEKSLVSPNILPTQTTPSLADLRDTLADWLHKNQKPTDQQLSTVNQLLPTPVTSNPIQQDNKSFTQPINNTTLPSFHISPPQPLFTIQDLSQRPIPPVSRATKLANDVEVKLLEALLFFIKQTGHRYSHEKVGLFDPGPDPQQKPSPKIRPDPAPNLISSPRDHNCIPRDRFRSRDWGPCAPRAPPPTALSSIDSQSSLNRPFPSLLLISGTRGRFVYSLQGILRIPVHHRHDGQEPLLISCTIDMAMVVEAKIVGNRILAISMCIVIVREEQRDDYVLFAAHSIMSSMRLFVAIQTVKWFGSVSIEILCHPGNPDAVSSSLMEKEGAYKISLKRNDAPSFCFWIRLVKAPTVKQVLNLIPKVIEQEFFDAALADVCPCISGGMATGSNNSDSALEVIADSVLINIHCPMSDALALALIEIDGIGAMDVVARLIVDFCAGEFTDARAKHIHYSSMVALSLEDKAVFKGGVMLGIK